MTKYSVYYHECTLYAADEAHLLRCCREWMGALAEKRNYCKLQQ